MSEKNCQRKRVVLAKLLPKLSWPYPLFDFGGRVVLEGIINFIVSI